MNILVICNLYNMYPGDSYSPVEMYPIRKEQIWVFSPFHVTDRNGAKQS